MKFNKKKRIPQAVPSSVQLRLRTPQGVPGSVLLRENTGNKKKHKKRSLTRKNQAPKRNPASNYSPTVKYAVPSSLGPLSIVFGMGT